MKRSDKKQIEKVEHGPFSVAILMCQTTGVFSCEYGALHTTGTLPAVRAWAKKTLREMCSLKWLPVMKVNFDDEDTNVNSLRNSSNISCYIERHWIAWDGKKWIRCPWVVDRPGCSMVIGPANSEREQDEMPESDLMAQRLARSQLFHDGPKTDNITWPIVAEGCGQKIYHVLYTEQHWQTMLGLLDKIRELRGAINRLLGTQGGWVMLAKIAETKLLMDATASGRTLTHG